MTLQFSLPDQPDLVVASDVHIRRECDDRSELLVALINEAARVGTKVFVLNGDIFDFFFGWGRYFSDKHQRIFDGLERLAALGSRVYFIEGNHEFGMERMTTKGVKYLDGYGDVIEAGDGARVLIAHGDLMKEDPKYLMFRSVVRSTFVSVLAWLMPQRWLDAFTLWFATTSRKKDRYRVLRHDKILACARETLEKQEAAHLVFGHFHHPYDETDGHGRRILSVDSWNKPNCLIYKAGVFTRAFSQ